MTVRSVVCVFGSPEELSALNAALSLAEIEPQNLRVLYVPAEPESLTDIHEGNKDDPESLAAALGNLMNEAGINPVAQQEPSEDDEQNGEDEEDEDEDEDEDFEENYENESRLLQEMADSIIRVTSSRGVCRLADLEADGFQASEIIRHWNTARKIAAVEMANAGQKVRNLAASA